MFRSYVLVRALSLCMIALCISAGAAHAQSGDQPRRRMFLPVVGRDALSASTETTPAAPIVTPPPLEHGGTYAVKLSVMREPAQTAPRVGESFTYVLSLSNNADAVDIVLTNTLPADVVLLSGLPDGATVDASNRITWRTQLPANSARSIALQVQVNRCPAGGSGLSNTTMLSYSGAAISASSAVSVAGCR